MKLWTPKKPPCHANGYLQAAHDKWAHFRRNRFARVGSLFVPQPLRMSPGYPCCCGEPAPESCIDVMANASSLSNLTAAFNGGTSLSDAYATNTCCEMLCDDGVYSGPDAAPSGLYGFTYYGPDLYGCDAECTAPTFPQVDSAAGGRIVLYCHDYDPPSYYIWYLGGHFTPSDCDYIMTLPNIGGASSSLSGVFPSTGSETITLTPNLGGWCSGTPPTSVTVSW